LEGNWIRLIHFLNSAIKVQFLEGGFYTSKRVFFVKRKLAVLKTLLMLRNILSLPVSGKYDKSPNTNSKLL